MTDYNLILIIGGTILLAAIFLPEACFKSLSVQLITLFVGMTVTFYGVQLLGQEIISISLKPFVLIFAERWSFTMFVIGSYLLATFLILRKLIRTNRPPKAS